MKHTFRIISLMVATALVASCGWFNKKDEELKPLELVDFRQTLKVRKIWDAKVGKDAEFLRLGLRPAGDGSRIYAAGHDGKVTAFNPENGRQIWRTELEVELTAGPGVGEGRVIVASKDGFAITLDAATGAEQWRTEVEGESLTTPLIKGDVVVLQTIDNRIETLSLFDGRQRWSIVQSAPALTMRGSASPAAVGQSLIAGFDSGRVVSADLDTGTIEWESLLAPPKGRSDLDRLSDVDGSITVVGQDIYAAGYQGRIAALASESGQVLWNREISTYSGVSADWNSIYTVTDEGEVVALKRSNGNEIWRNASLLRREPTLPVPFNTTVVVGDLEGYLHFFNNIDGEPVARVRLGSKGISAVPLVVANRLYVQSDGGTIAAYVVVDDRPKRTQPDVAEDGS
ncbi:MAG: outer membrane protein assembly factor BamB [Gammaproteobacteria bacterium]|nr:outer membrane protein assembly factor BamB [Gammaproteobacteria bacterium]